MSKAAHKKQREVLSPARTGRFTAVEVGRVIKGVHVVPRGPSGWAVRKVGPREQTRVFQDKDAAIEWAMELARSRHALIYVHGRNGTVSTRSVVGTKSSARA